MRSTFALRLLGCMGGVAVSVAVASTTACSGGGGATDGGIGDGASSDGRFSFDGSRGDAGCDAPAPTTVLDDVQAVALQLAGDELVFIDLAAGMPFYPGSSTNNRAIRKVRRDGTGDTVLYAAPAGKQINDLVVSGGAIYFLESTRLMSTAEDTRVYSLPVTGGTPTLIALHDDPQNGVGGDRLDAIVGVDATNLYLVRNILTPASMFRMAIAGGAEAVMTRVPMGTRPTLVGTDFFFLTGAFPSGPNAKGIGKLPASANDAMPTQVGMAYCSGDFGAGTWGFLCTGADQTMSRDKLSKFDVAGGAHQELFNYTELVVPTLQIGPTDGTHVYVTGNQSTSQRAALHKVPLAGGASTPVACERAQIRPRGGGNNGAYSIGMEMVLSATELFWIETQKDRTTDVEKTAIYRTTR
jgi:hypothetical protein